MEYPSSELINIFKKTPGAMSVAEGVALYNICLLAPEGVWVELGTHRGKSTTMIASAVKGNTELSLVEPEFSNDEWRKGVLNLIGSMLPSSGLCLYSGYSTDILPKIKDKLSFLFVDSGNHGEEIVQSEKPLYEDKILPGGIIAFHDLNSQFTAVTRCYHQLIETGKYEAINIDWEQILDYVKGNNLEENNDSWHIYSELPHPPNFIGAIRRL